MPRHSIFHVLLFLTGLGSMTSCLEVAPIWKESRVLENYLLSSDSAACKFDLDIDSLAPIMYVKVELEITYDTYTGRNELPLTIEIQDPAGTFILASTAVEIPIRKQGKWLGYPYKPREEYIVLHTAIPRQKVYPGSYTLSLSANNKDLSFLPGIIAIGVRIYQV